MNSRQLWERFTRYYNFYPEVGFSLDISRMRFADDFLSTMEGRMSRAFDEMEALERGEIVNQDEQRMVGHYWLRSPELAPNGALRQEIQFTTDKMKAFAKDVHSGSIPPEKKSRFENVLLIGIGGSALGPQLLADALGCSKDKMKIHFCDNTDPDGLSRLVERLSSELDRTLCIVISKSGGTPETRNGALEIAAAYKQQGLSFARHAIAVTCDGSKLDNQAKEEEWLARFPMWDWVGGRTSLFSAVGMLAAALQGIDIDAFIAGGRVMDEITRSRTTAKNPAALLALMWYSAGSGKGLKDMVVLPYRDRLVLFSKYLQQLVMESLGKEKDRQGAVVNQGIAVYGNKGSTDQHAYVQQLREGINNFFVTFIKVENDLSAFAPKNPLMMVEPGITSGDYLLGFHLGTRRALYENGRDSITIGLERLDTSSLGSLIALFDRAVGLYASLVNINAYHQPGVEAGKKAAAQVLDVQKAVMGAMKSVPALDGETAEAIAERAGMKEEVETVFSILEHLASNESFGITRLARGNPKETRFAPSK